MPASDGDPPAGIAVRRIGLGRLGRHGGSSLDDVAYVMGRHSDRAIGRPVHGWSSSGRSASPRRRSGRRLGAVLLLLPLVVGLLGSPTAPNAKGDELSDARARQEQLKKDAAAQKAAIARLNALQSGLAAEIHSTASQLKGINADLVSVKKKITSMQGRINDVKAQYDGLVTQLDALDAKLIDVQTREAAKRDELIERKALLGQRLRSAYDTDRTSLLESFLSGGTFTDLLTEVSYYIDVGEQDKALAVQIVHDQEVLASLHQTVVDTRTQTEELRVETAAQRTALDQSMADLKEAKAILKKLEKATAIALAQQKRAYATLASNKSAARKALARSAAAEKRLQAQISEIIRKQASNGRIPSDYNGTLEWPMGGEVTQNFGCTGFGWEPPLGSCSHFHRGIDIVADYGTPVRASGDGEIVYIGWNYADGADPAWIVIVAHSQSLQTWYAHMEPRYPGGIRVGSHVSKGQVIGYEGNTGHSTGAHLHWAVMLDGEFANPRLFI